MPSSGCCCSALACSVFAPVPLSCHFSSNWKLWHSAFVSCLLNEIRLCPYPTASCWQDIVSLSCALPCATWWSFGIDIWLQSPTHSILQMLLLLLFCFFSFGPLADRSSFEFLRASCEIVWNPSNRKALIYYTVILMRTTPCTFHLKSQDL